MSSRVHFARPRESVPAIGARIRYRMILLCSTIARNGEMTDRWGERQDKRSRVEMQYETRAPAEITRILAEV